MGGQAILHFKEEGLPVDYVESISDVEYDFVFISIADDKNSRRNNI